jgi:hypothetical protein
LIKALEQEGNRGGLSWTGSWHDRRIMLTAGDLVVILIWIHMRGAGGIRLTESGKRKKEGIQSNPGVKHAKAYTFIQVTSGHGNRM